MKKKLALVALLMFVCFSTPAFALQSTYYGYDGGYMVTTNSDLAKAAFFANLEGVGTETFESFSAGQSLPITVDFGIAGTATLQGLGNHLVHLLRGENYIFNLSRYVK